jgi:CheY-like chemotaxis protein
VTNDDLLNALEVALDLQCFDAAASFLRAFPKNSADSAFNSRAPRVLSEALKSPDARVRTLAARIARTRFSGQCSSSTVSRTFLAAKNGSLKSEIVIVSPDDSQLRTLQAVFQDAGFTADIAETGPDGFQLAASQLNCELFVLQAESPIWPMATTVANLRADVRTRNTPVVIIGHPRFQDRVAALAEIYDGVWFISEPAGTESLLSKMAQTNIPPAALTAEDRAAIKALAE